MQNNLSKSQITNTQNSDIQIEAKGIAAQNINAQSANLQRLNSSTYDTIIIGAGSSGLIAACQLKSRFSNSHKVLIVDHSDKIATKLLISGGGKCNFTNKNVTHENYISSNISFTRSALARYKPTDIIKKIQKANITYEEREHGQMFTTTSSKDIVEHIRSKLLDTEISLNTAVQEIAQLNNHGEYRFSVALKAISVTTKEGATEISTETIRDSAPHASAKCAKTEEIYKEFRADNTDDTKLNNQKQDSANINSRNQKSDNGDRINCNHDNKKPNINNIDINNIDVNNIGIDSPYINNPNNEQCNNVLCKNLIIATGGVAYPQAGATDFGYRVAEQFGHKIIAPRPGLTPLILDQKLNFSALAGISLNVLLSINKRQFLLPLLFTHQGISGPAALQASNYWREGDTISIDFLPNLKESLNNIFNDPSNNKSTVATQLSKLLPTRLVKTILTPTAQDYWCCSIPKGSRVEIINSVHDFTTTPTGVEGFNKAEISIGGIELSQVDSKTMQSKLADGLYFIGELLDVSGHLGGYNLHWAYVSAMAAADSIDT